MDVESNSGVNKSCVSDVSTPKRNKCLFVFGSVFHLGLCCYYTTLFVLAFFVLRDAINSENELCRFMGYFGPAFGTNWNVTFQTVFLFLALAHDILEWMNKQDTLRARQIAYWRDVVFNSLVVPFTMFVTIMFWTLYLIDRDLVFPEVFDTIVPWWFNHCVHTNIAIILVVETLLTPRRHPTNKSLELKISTFVTFGYAVVYYSIFFLTNRWLYNIFGIMTWWQVCLYQLCIWASTYVFYFMHFPINRLIHGQGESIEDANSPQQSNGTQKSVEISTIQKNSADDAFSSDNWHLKYRSLRDKFENSRL